MSLYDPLVVAANNEIVGKLGKMDRASLMNAIEPHLRSCICTGRFGDKSSQWCHLCQAEIIVKDPSWDLWPGCFASHQETEGSEHQAQQFTDEFRRWEDIWLR